MKGMYNMLYAEMKEEVENIEKAMCVVNNDHAKGLLQYRKDYLDSYIKFIEYHFMNPLSTQELIDFYDQANRDNTCSHMI